MHMIIIWATTVSTWVEQVSRKENNILSMHKLAGVHTKNPKGRKETKSFCAQAGLGAHPPQKKTGETIVPSIMHKLTQVHTKVGGKILPCIGYTQKPFNRPSEFLPVWFINLVRLITSEQELLNHTSFHPARKEPISASSTQKESSMHASIHVLTHEHTHKIQLTRKSVCNQINHK